jgi:NTE family protein
VSHALEPAELKRFWLCSEFSAEDREALFDLLEFSSIPKGRSIYRETGEGDGLVMVVSGSVSLESSRGEKLGTLYENSVLGVTSVLSTSRRAATAKAETACEVLTLARGAYRRLLEDHPRAGCRLTEAIAAHLAGLLREGLDQLMPPAG